MSAPRKTGPTRIQQKNRSLIEEAALDVFSVEGFRGATLDQIAHKAGISKPNILYYYASKEEIYSALLNRILMVWLEPLRAMDPKGVPMDEILTYVRAKLTMSRKFPRESRLFANEIIRGAPYVHELLQTELRELTDEKTAVLRVWMDQGILKQVDPYHLLFAIWSMTQHYADFDFQVRFLLDGKDPFEEAENFLTILLTGLLPKD